MGCLYQNLSLKVWGSVQKLMQSKYKSQRWWIRESSRHNNADAHVELTETATTCTKAAWVQATQNTNTKNNKSAYFLLKVPHSIKKLLAIVTYWERKSQFFFWCSDIGYVNQTLELTPKLKVLSLSSERDPHIFVHFFVLLSSVYSFVLFLCCCYFLFEREKYVCCVFRAMGRI